MQERGRVWFHAKRYGWGWGLPASWQGWLVMTAYVALMTVGAYGLLRDMHVLLYLGFALALTAGLIGVCWIKGERPRWRGGEDS